MCDRVSIDLPAEASAAGHAREFVRRHCARWGLAELGEDLQLPTSELVTNAVRHCGSPVHVQVDLDRREVRVCVRDECPRPPAARSPRDARPGDGPPEWTSGRGLHIVAAVAGDWTVEPVPGGKQVGFRLRAPDAWQPPTPCACVRRTR